MINWQHVWETILLQVHDHGSKVLTGAVLMALGWLVGRRRARADWTKKAFFDRFNMSLNTIQGGKLLIRTLSEKRLEDVYLNAVAAERVKAAAQKTTTQDSTLPLPKEDYWYYLNPVLNELSEQFAEGFMKQNLQLPTSCASYLIAITSECDAELRMRKVRAMVVQKSLLTQLPAEPPNLENKNHATRWRTLQQLSAEYAKNPHKFLELELCV